MRTAGTIRAIAAVIILAGAILLIASVFAPWYYETLTDYRGSATTDFYLGTPSQDRTIEDECMVHLVCYPTPCCSNGPPLSVNDTAAIVKTTLVVVIVGAVFGAAAAALGVASRRSARPTFPALVLTLVALVAAVAAPVFFAATLPGAIGTDVTNAHHVTPNGPWDSFYGSSSGPGPAFLNNTASLLTLDWGPNVGWYLSIAAFALLLVGFVILVGARKEPPEPAPVTFSATPTTLPTVAPASSSAP